MVTEEIRSYTGCKLELPDTEPAAAEVNSPLPKSLTQRITASLNPATTDSSTPPTPLKQEGSTSSYSTHVVKKTIIIQCPTALEDATQTGREQKDRRCAVLTPLSGVSEPEAVGEPFPTPHRGICPVCKAAEEAVIGALRREEIVSSANGTFEDRANGAIEVS